MTNASRVYGSTFYSVVANFRTGGGLWVGCPLAQRSQPMRQVWLEEGQSGTLQGLTLRAGPLPPSLWIQLHIWI